MKKGYIYGQSDLFGNRKIIGYSNGIVCVKTIERNVANDIIAKNHYSKGFVHSSTIHLGVFKDDKLLGCLQYGCAMNPASGSSVVAGTKMDEYLELNRMWIDDCLPRNSESSAISCSIKYIKAVYPKVKWIQSFADSRCGKLGVVYQACSFDYYGEHDSVFWEIDGAFYHNSLMTRDRSLRPSAAYCQDNKERAKKHVFRQFRYIKFLDKRWKKKCKHKRKEYPKK